MKKALALDIGGTKIFSALVNEEGKIISPVEKHSTPKTLEDIKDTLSAICEKHEDEVDVVTIATAGAVNTENTKIISSTANLVEGYPSIDFSFLSKRKVFLENDANCAAWAEHIVGSAKGYSNSITITLGTGVGGGIIVDDKLLKGKSGAAGEMHFKISTDKKRRCTCGAWDCWEIYASGNGLRLTAVEMLSREATSYEVIEGMQKGNPTMKAIFEKWQDYITDGLIGLANIFDPDCIVLSGSMAEFVDIKKVQEIVNNEIVTTPVKILHASAGNYAGLIGAALLGLKTV